MRFEAIRLFDERARLVQPAFAVTSTNAPFIARVCRRLDGIPLAVELAAARVNVLTMEQIARRLDDCFDLLVAGTRTALPRHQTLRATIDWSYALLSANERLLFDRLAVFAGEWTLEAAEEVCTDSDLPRREVLDLLGRLVDKSLVLVDAHREGAARYRLLETLRQYGREHLLARPTPNTVYERHGAYFLGVAEQGELKIRGPEQTAWLDRLETDLDNIRAALQRLSEREDRASVDQGLRLAGALWFFWFLRGYRSEGLYWVERFLAVSAPEDRTAARAKALNAAGFLASSRLRFEEALSIRRGLGDRPGIALALIGLGFVIANKEGDLDKASALYTESLPIWHELGDPWGAGWAFSFLATAAQRQGRTLEARSLYEESLVFRRLAQDQQGISYSLHGLGDALHELGDRAGARSAYEETLAICRQVGDRPNIATSLASLGEVALEDGDAVQATSRFTESLAIAAEMGELMEQIHVSGRGAIGRSLAGLAIAAAVRGDAVRAARLGGAAERYHEAMGLTPIESKRMEMQHRLEPARRTLGEPGYRAAWDEGRRTTAEAAVALALEAAPSQR